MQPSTERFLNQHQHLTRRFFLRFGVVGVAALKTLPSFAADSQRPPELQQAISDLETWLTAQDKFADVSRGNPKPHSLDEAQRQAVGLTRETWNLEVLADPDNKPRLRNPLTGDNAFTFADLMQLAQTEAVRFPKIMTCLNLGCPLGTGIWEGVPLRSVIWKTEPIENLRRVFYHGYHNDDPEQMFRSSLPIGRVFEDPFGLPPVILCYKLNGDWLTPERGGPVRIVVPEAYGFKNIKWLSHLYLSNSWQSNDTYGEKNNDVDSPLKTFCETLSVPNTVEANQPIPITGYAQVGISGLKKVQVWIHRDQDPLPDGGKYFVNAPWQDAEILPVPANWGGNLPDDKIPSPTHGFDPKTGQPLIWPMRLTKAHWAALHPGLPSGEYTLRCRTIDENGAAQPMPRPFQKSGRAAIQSVAVLVK